MAETLEEFLIEIGFDVDFDEADGEFDGSMTRWRKHSAATAEAVAGVFRRATVIAAGAIASVAASAAGAIHHYVEAGSEVRILAQQLGVGTTELQRMQAGIRATGGDAGVLKDALKTMQIGLQEASIKGTGPFWEGLKLVGVELEELQGYDTEDQIGFLADALNEIGDPADRAAARLRLFGESGGLELAGYLDKGSEGMIRLGDEAERMGLVLDEDAVAGAQRLNASLGQLTAVGGAVVAQVGGQLAPSLQDAADRAMAWVDSNEQFIQQDLPAAITATVNALGDLIAWLVDVQHEFRAFGKDVELVYLELTEAATAVGDLASSIADELEPAVDVVLWPLQQIVDVANAITGAVASAVVQIADMVGVLDDVQAAYRALPFVDGEGDVRVARGAPQLSTAEGRAAAEAQRERKRQADIAAAIPGAVMASAAVQAAAEALAGEGRDRTAASVRRGVARTAGRAALAPPKPGGGGGGKASSSSAGSSKGGWLDKLGLGGLFDEQGGEGLAGLLGIGGFDHAPAGGGSSPLAGATFVTQDVNTSATVTINLPPGALAGLSHADQAHAIAVALEDVLGSQNRQALDYVQRPIRG